MMEAYNLLLTKWNSQLIVYISLKLKVLSKNNYWLLNFGSENDTIYAVTRISFHVCIHI